MKGIFEYSSFFHLFFIRNIFTKFEHDSESLHIMKNYFISFICFTTLLLSSCGTPILTDNLLLPKPQSVESGKGYFRVPNELPIQIVAPNDAAGRLVAVLTKAGVAYQQTDTSKGLSIQLTDDSSLPASKEGYRLIISPEEVKLTARGEAGLFYGLQTFVALHEQYDSRIPAGTIIDYPRFEWRGMHLDVSRNFFDKKFIKKQLRMMASLRLNRLHWHLVDGAGWRLEIDRYPLLTEFAAWRHGKTWHDWWTSGRRYGRHDEAGVSGGFYTKEDIREVLDCADSLHITVVPEIEFPSHSEEVLAAYPKLSCTNKGGGEFCIGNEQTFEFMENVLTEVMELFPSEYIHIGGDEAAKEAWATCPKCRTRMAREGLTDVNELQSYGIRRMERFLRSRGRKLIGWDEILDGGLAEGAVVMSWRGEEGGRKAAESGHSVIMTPGSHCYFDSYQDNPMREPMAMSGYLPLSKVYEYDPAPADMVGREWVLGVQANLWTEYIPTPEHAEYMLYPRHFALAEVAWSNPEQKDFTDFRRRAVVRTDKARAAGYNAFDLHSESGERPEKAEPIDHLARGCEVTYTTPWHPKYSAEGASSLTNGLRGGWSYGTRWQGFLSCDMEVTIDLKTTQPIRSIEADFIQWFAAWVWLPREVIIAVSEDGKEFRELTVVKNDYPEEEERPEYRKFGWQGKTTGRYVRYRAVSNGRAGGWLFTDEIVVR